MRRIWKQQGLKGVVNLHAFWIVGGAKLEANYYKEMAENCEEMEQRGLLENKRIFLFGHCNATEELAELLNQKGHSIAAILDNSREKHGKVYHNIPVVPPDSILPEDGEKAVVCIAARFYEAMQAQLRRLGFTGEIRKMVDYNTYAEYSLSDETIERKWKRVEYGKSAVRELERKYPGYFRIFCPFSALGDLYFCMSYLPYFLRKRGRKDYIMCVAGSACAKVAELFDDCPVEVMGQKELDAMIQAELYMQDREAFIAHQDRPYVVNLSGALYRKKIPLEKIYCCGVFGLPQDTEPVVPARWNDYADLAAIEKDRAVILSPYAKSVTALPAKIWEDIILDYRKRGFQIFTNVAGDETPLPGTIAISPGISELKSVVERAGTFIGLRSGICDVLRTADCRKIALYPDYNYCDTQWKAIDMYAIDTFENIVVKDDFEWRKN